MKKDFQSIISEMQQLEKLSSHSHSFRQSHRSKYTVKGFMDMQKTVAGPFPKREAPQLQAAKQTVVMRSRVQPSQAAISQQRARVIQNISVDDIDQRAPPSRLNYSQLNSFREDLNSSRKRGNSNDVQEKLMRGLSRQGRDSPPRPPTQSQLPTRRAYMHISSNEDWLLGAGADPLLKDLQFSQLAGNGASLFTARFTQPKNAQIRLPPLLDQFSHTLASPISTQKFNLPPSARIAQNFSVKAKCMMIDLQSKAIVFNRQRQQGIANVSFPAQAHLLQPIATDAEELNYIKTKNIRLRMKVQAKLQCYQRYQLYIAQEINETHIAPIRQAWVHKVLDLVPGSYDDLNDDIMKYLVDGMLREVNTLYVDSMRKSILDYILLEEEERMRLGIMTTFDGVVLYGEELSKKVHLQIDFRAVHQDVAQRLLSYTDVSASVLNEWQVNNNQFTLLVLPVPGVEPVSLEEFTRKHSEKIQSVRNMIKQKWVPSICAKYQEHFQRLKNEYPLMAKDDFDEYQKHFFITNATLISNLMRQLVTQNIVLYTNFFNQFVLRDGRRMTEVVEEQKHRIKECQWHHSFLVVTIKETRQAIDFSESPADIKEKLLHLFEEVLQVTQGVLRPEEHTMSKKDKVFLSEVTLRDPWFQQCHLQIDQTIEQNVSFAYEVLDLYNKYTFLLREMERVVQFIQSKQNPIEEIPSPQRKNKPEQKAAATLQFHRSVFQVRKDEFLGEVQRYLTLYQEIEDQVPFFVKVGFIHVDGGQIKARLLSICHELVDFMFNSVLEFVVRRSNEISKDIQFLIESISVIPESTKSLIELEALIERIDHKENRVLNEDFVEIVYWMYVLINQRVKFTSDDLKGLHKTSLQIKSLMDRVRVEEDRLKEERVKFENDLRRRREVFNIDIDALRRDIDSLEGYESAFMMKDANEQIDQLNLTLEGLVNDLSDINENEEMLGQNQSDYPRLQQAQAKLKPYEDLWRLVRDFKLNYQTWTRETPVFKLNPEEIEKTTKTMIATAGTLQKMFRGLQIERERQQQAKQLGKQKQIAATNLVTGPSKLVEEIFVEIMEFQRHVPLVAICCNPGLKDRHWDEISKRVGYPISPDRDIPFKKLIDAESIKFVPELDEISENASREYEIERVLARMKDDIKSYQAELKPWKDTGTFILAGGFIEEVLQVLEDQAVKTQAMKSSPYARIFEKQISYWEDWLNFTMSFLDYGVKVQSVWLYLEPVFTSPDISKHLPSEGVKFKHVDEKWRYVMKYVSENPNLLVFTKQQELLDLLKECHVILEVVQKGLNTYLEGKRAAFPRFYFLSNDELLEILSETKDPQRVQPHLKKCFEGIHKIKLDEQKAVHGMYSSEDEYVPFMQAVDTNAANGKVDQWLLETERQMLLALRDVIERGYLEYMKQEREAWVIRRCGQAVLSVAMAYWTHETETAIQDTELRNYYEKLSQQLDNVVSLVRQEISPLDRCTIEALIVLDVHNRDVVGLLKQENVDKVQTFLWQAQLRYYWHDNMRVRIINADLDYNYEYLGNSPRLVITPLTDRCYRTLCGAVHLNYGGAPEGPAGTGKTETVKDLAKALARQCVVFNCSDGLDYKAMGKFFRGLASSGAWSCFDEFNRIDLEVLSVVAQQIQTIQIARAQQLEQFFFEDSMIPLKTTCNVFITMNPGYAGRSELPDNLKALFRSVAMMVPDYAMIAEISLYSYGFSKARTLSRKIVTTYKLCSEQLSSQDHYDYGMRAVKSVLVAAGNLKRKFPFEDEQILTLKAINEVNSAKFLRQDLMLFEGITQDLFPGVVLPQIDYKVMLECMQEVMGLSKLIPKNYFVDKVIQIYEMILVRHGLMVVGRPFAGKTSALNVLEQTLTMLSDRALQNEYRVLSVRLNPKSVSMKQLYGQFDEVSHEWTDGVLPVKFRNLVREDANDAPTLRKWVIFDGPVDAVWIENMNTVLDDNKKLCLNSGEIIPMGKMMSMIFEPMDLEAASPATVSRCGMIYMEPEILGWEVLYDSWRLTIELPEQDMQLLHWLVHYGVPLTLEQVRSLQTVSRVQDSSLVCTLLRWLTVMLRQFPTDIEDPKARQAALESRFVFALVWALGGAVNTANRRVMDKFFKKLCSGDLQPDPKQKRRLQVPDRGSIFEYNFTTQNRSEGEWIQWSSQLDVAEQFSQRLQPQEIFVSTIDSLRYTRLLEIAVSEQYPLLFCGPTGTGKSTYIKRYFSLLPESDYVPIEIGFSAQTKAGFVQDIVDGRIDKRRKGQKIVYCPKQGRLLLFIDDLNMPHKEKWGAQPPIELVRQLVDQGGWYDHRDKVFKNIVDTSVVTAMGLSGGGRSEITPRLLRHLSLVSITDFDDDNLQRIFSTIVKWFLGGRGFSPEVLKLDTKIVLATSDIYKAVIKDLLPTPQRSHYLFNLRDLAKVIFGVCQVDKDRVSTPDQLTRLWVHEVLRVFGDRLINDEDKKFLLRSIRGVFTRDFNLNFDNVFTYLDQIDPVTRKGDGKVDTLEEMSRLVWSDIISVTQGGQKRLYEEVVDLQYLQSTLEQSLQSLNVVAEKPLELVLFNYAIDHLLAIWRVLRQQGGNALLVGVGGSGKQSLTRLAATFGEYNIIQIEISKTYDQNQWKEDLKSLLNLAGGKQQPTVFLMDEGQIKYESFLDDINSLLNTFEVPNLFASEEKVELTEAIRQSASKNSDALKQASIQQLYSEFVSRVKRYLHLVLCFSPIGDAFRTRMRMFPSLVNCCTIDWFQDWPDSGLLSVANKFLGHIDMAQDTLEMSIRVCQYFHQSTQRYAMQYWQELKRKLYVTPTSFLELIQVFKSLLSDKRRQNRSDQMKYSTGYKQIVQTESTVEEMQQNLIKLQPQLKEAAAATQIKMQEVSVQKSAADQLKEVIVGEEQVVQDAVNEANKIKEDCENDLREAMPDLIAAEDALKVLDKKQIEFLKTMKNPSQPIKDTLQALCLIMYPKPTEQRRNNETLKNEVDWWAASLKLLGNTKLLEDMLHFDRENVPEPIIMGLGKFLNDPASQKTLDEHVVENASTACKCILKWVNGIYKFYFVNRKVKPKKEALRQSEQKVNMLNSQLSEKQRRLQNAIQSVAKLNRELAETERRKEQLEREYQECSVQLERAKQLIVNLGGEKGRWVQLADQLHDDFDKLTGDVLVSAGVIAYLGGYTAAFRRDITSLWFDKVQRSNIPCSNLYSIDRVLGSPVEIRRWQMNGLPSDAFSTSNGIIMYQSRRWPLCIDPQGQANRWIKRSYKQLNVVKLSDSDFLRTLENAIQFGKCVLMENVLEELDPTLSPVLLKSTTQRGQTLYLKLGDHTIEYSPHFKFFITTKLRNPHYLPQISVKVTLINFMITQEGLADQLLALLVKKEKPQLEEQKEQLIMDSANNKKQLQEIEEKILQVLSSDKNILTDEEAIVVLTASKVKSIEINEKQKIAEITELSIDAARQEYEPFAQQAACLFFGIADLNNIDPMYQYSLSYYTDLFSLSVSKAEKSNEIQQRLANLSSYFLYSLYCNICRGLFEKDKLLFSFLLTIRLLEFKHELDHSHLRFLLTGTIPLSQQTRQVHPIDTAVEQWLPARNVQEVLILAQLPEFMSLPSELGSFMDEWRQIFDSNTPEEHMVPAQLSRRYSELQKLCILRALRPDKMVFAFELFIKREMGPKFLQPPQFDLPSIYADSHTTTPLIFILSPGSDPFQTLTNFAQVHRQGMAVQSISLGQGQGPIAAKMIRQGIKSGEWVVLQNCHLAVTWMPHLEKLCEELSPDPSETNPGFRLWLTSYPSAAFPVTILQNGIKITNEPPKGLKANLIGSYMTDPISDPKFFDGCHQSQAFKKLVFGLCFFHAVIQERKKYGPLGWNIAYEFNESDLRISVRQLRIFLDEDQREIPFEALTYLTAECNYGGRVTDDKDRRLIKTLLGDYYNSNLVKDFMFKLDPMGSYKIPDVEVYAEYVDYIKSQNTHTHPSVLGLHANADITRELAESNELLQAVFTSNSELCKEQEAAGKKQTTVLTEEDEEEAVPAPVTNQFQVLLQTILDEFPGPFDEEAALVKYPVDYKESMNTVLTQEISRYNILINVVRNSLHDMILAEQGKLQLNSQLEKASFAIQEARVPDVWMEKSYPSKKPLGAYLTDLKKRIAFLRKWYDEGTPQIFWVSGFYFTQSYLTGVLQNYARRKMIPIDEVQFDFGIQRFSEETEGTFINGLYLEGCKWNYAKMELDESDPKVLFVECPLIQLRPAEVKHINPAPHYECPVYKTSARRGVLSTTGHSTNFVLWIRLPTSRPETHWIKRGVALLTQLDD